MNNAADVDGEENELDSDRQAAAQKIQKNSNRANTAANSHIDATEQQKKSALNLVWNCLTPTARKKFVEDKKKQQSLLQKNYFEYFDLNNKVEFFSYLGEDDYEKFMQEYWPLQEDRDDSTKRSKVFRSELLHHKYFYLNKEVTEEMYSEDEKHKKDKAEIISESQKLPQLKNLVQ